MFINDIEVTEEALHAAAQDILLSYTNEDQLYHEDLEALVGISLHPGAVSVNSSEWRGYTQHRNSLKKAVNRALATIADDPDHPDAPFAALVSARDEENQPALEVHIDDAVAVQIMEHHKKKVKRAPANLIRDLDRVAKHAQISDTSRKEINKMIYIGSVLNDAAESMIEVMQRRINLPKATVRRLLVEAAEAPKDGAQVLNPQGGV